MRPLSRFWRFGQEAVDEIKNSNLRPSIIYAVIVVAFFIFSLIAVAELISGQVIHRYWTSFWYYSILTDTPPLVRYFLVNFLFDALLLILCIFLPVFGTLAYYGCRRSARKIRNCFAALAVPLVFLWDLLMFLLTPTNLFGDGFNSSILWTQAVSASLLAQYIGLVTTTYGLLWALRHASKTMTTNP